MPTVLVVDDEPQVRTMVATVLTAEGFTVLTADCGLQALSQFHSHPGEIDLLISDIMMPGMDGTSLATKLKSIYPDLGVLLMSGNCQSRHIDIEFAFLHKPFTMQDLLSRVRVLLKIRQTVAPLVPR